VIFFAGESGFQMILFTVFMKKTEGGKGKGGKEEGREGR